MVRWRSRDEERRYQPADQGQVAGRHPFEQMEKAGDLGDHGAMLLAWEGHLASSLSPHKERKTSAVASPRDSR